jgi:predicted transcriptional regulator
MTIRVTMIYWVDQAVKKNKRPATLHDVYAVCGMKYPKFSQKLWELAKGELLIKNEIDDRPAYKLSPKGIQDLKTNSALVFTKEQLVEWTQGQANSRTTKITETPRYSKDALSAIDSIAQIIDKNEKLVVALRQIRNQIDFLIGDHNE